ncbi:diguanylate cyclase [Halomonas daqingensis]|uniref:diguanylate cyclase n=1 Tax=Billgrantia desiderata TaxID=52021 RepID=A0AAW4YTX6_9GAMM|nr:GGDEF domain-containing protein [Halomonas desiderata]MCE8012497.1 diguanylate cyclase [Halomonas desiderata]MCE8027751.1 diguanylate cyclase [Halomonas desiderata]MCE8043386.1 diguanylate cyclase [Halomonas desiderata]MCE8047961.1 diguanylate cyclase [Halomonas desiderata]MCE8051310.1 diguanylate cyclase [Halomonas desiderata]
MLTFKALSHKPFGARRPHRLALATLPPRAFAFLHTFGLTVWIALVEGSGWSLILPGLLLLLWPAIAYLHAAQAQDSKQAEFKNLLFDSLLFGVWCSVLDFYVLATLSIALACFMNNMVVAGPRRMLVSMALFAGGALGWSALTGFEIRPYVSTGLDIYQGAGAVAYFLAIAYVMYGQNRQLGRSMREIKFQNRVFHALLELGGVANSASNIHMLLDDSLKHLHADFPEYGFAVFLQERNRPEVTRYAAVAGLQLGAEDERRLGGLLAKLHDRQESVVKLREKSVGEQLYATSMAGRLSQYEGWLIVRAPKLDGRLERMLTLFVDQLAAATENKLLHLALKKTAERDGLTGLYNRGFFESALQLSVQGKGQTPSLDFAVLMVDVDGLKVVNDRYGHVAGDQLITTVAERLQVHCRASDILARYGGDEFVVLFPSADLTAANRLASLIRTHIEGQRCSITTADGKRLTLELRLSLGGASSTEVPAQEVLTLADERMYDDKTRRRKQRALS